MKPDFHDQIVHKFYREYDSDKYLYEMHYEGKRVNWRIINGSEPEALFFKNILVPMYEEIEKVNDEI